MDLYLISGFLGSGKTTTIIELSKYLMKQGKKVGVVTNDQGKYLVDTAFIRASDIPAVDVQSGCFCSNYQDLIRQLDELKNTIDPDVVFAESIGSAGNLVGSVMSPLLDGSDYRPKALCSVVDARLLFRLLNGDFLPFSDSVNATFVNQLRESDLLIINKLDLIDSAIETQIVTLMPSLFGSKDFIFQSAKSPADIQNTFERISLVKTAAETDPSFDPHRHQMALEKLQWSEDIHMLKNSTGTRSDIEAIISALLAKLKADNCIIAHIKILIESDEGTNKLSITSLDNDDWRRDLQKINPKEAKITINSRVQI
jgi:G3E family GTPase